MKTLAVLVFVLTELHVPAHYQRNQYVDNSKSNKAIVFILTHDTDLDKLTPPVKFESAILYC